VKLQEHFDLLATTPGGVARLRELILTLAVQGKLVPQEPADEPASKLLERIRAEKTRLVREGKIRKEKSLAEIANEEKPFDVPEGWEWVRLGDITNFGSPTKAKSLNDTTWVLDLEDVEKGTGRLIQRFRFAERRSLSDKNCFSEGDVLYGKLRPYLNKVLVADEKGVCTTEIIPFRCYGPYVPDYFRIALSGPFFLSYVNAKSYGMKMPRLGTEDGRNAVIALPPFAEQSRIVARVDELMQLCDALEARGRLEAEQHARLTGALFDALAASESAHALAENWQRIAAHFDLLLDRPEAVDALEQTLLQLAVRGLLVPQDPTDEPASVLLKKIRAEKDRLIAEGKIKRDKALPPVAEQEKPFELPEGWEWARFSELGEFGRGKSKHRPRNDPRLFEPGKYPLVQTGEVARADKVILEFHSKYSEAGLAQSKMWPAGTLCITIAANIADAAILGFDACFPDSVVGLVPASVIGNSEYFLAFMATARDRLFEFAPATAQKNINLEILNSVLIPLPPAREMTAIVARVAELRALCTDLRQRLTSARHTQSRLAEALADSVSA
jgi:type I restriction enzyme, S subunit